MKNSIFNYVAVLCLFLLTTSGKIKKDVSVGKSDCKGVGFNCSPDKGSTKVAATYVFDEPHRGNFSMEFAEADVLRSAQLLLFFRDGNTINLDETLIIPDDVREGLNIPKAFKVPEGEYPFQLKDHIFKIVFVE